jgi:hypothetical protein
MSSGKGFFRSAQIQIALVTGFCIIVLAYFSKKILPEPIGFLSLAIPAFIATVYESFRSKYNYLRIFKKGYWLLAILLSTLLIIILHL